MGRDAKKGNLTLVTDAPPEAEDDGCRGRGRATRARLNRLRLVNVVGWQPPDVEGAPQRHAVSYQGRAVRRPELAAGRKHELPVGVDAAYPRDDAASARDRRRHRTALAGMAARDGTRRHPAMTLACCSRRFAIWTTSSTRSSRCSKRNRRKSSGTGSASRNPSVTSSRTPLSMPAAMSGTWN